jgi:CBS-domain-containing membrane protein
MSELYQSSDRRLPAKLVPPFADKGSHVVSVMDPYSRVIDFLDQSPYLFFKAAL